MLGVYFLLEQIKSDNQILETIQLAGAMQKKTILNKKSLEENGTNLYNHSISFNFRNVQ